MLCAVLGGAALLPAVSAGAGAGGLIRASVGEHGVAFSSPLHAGLLRLHITSHGIEPHHLIFWQLHRGVSFAKFDKVDASNNGNPFKLAKVIGGNGQLAPGHSMDIWIRVAKGRIAIDDIPAGPGNGFHRDVTVRRAGQSVATPVPVGTIKAIAGDRYVLPAGFGTPGIYEFSNTDIEVHEATIVPLMPGKTVTDLITWVKNGRKGASPAAGFDGGFGALQGHSRAWFTIGKLPPGSYAVACFVPGADGIPHIVMGMAAGFTVQ